ncbi:MAG: acetyl/propionyl/methylcrotonyl-CoA carboxylase subunit alpha [Proteobacteria bacterium]|nr:acetyl/propionyl/methylcrotonyl-CoA carboxylase subunit alpha [Pseudomonadota bacterium]
MIERLLIANRGEIAVRVARTAKRMGVHVIAVYSDTDAAAMHVAVADEAVRIGPDAAAESYLNIDAVIAAARETRADAIHPGYGFLSENAEFADACGAAGIRLVGPSAAAMRAMGDKAASKDVMAKADVPLMPGYHGADQDPAILAAKAAEIGFPVLIKASAGGGGRGMRIVESAGGFDEALAAAQREARGAFGNDRVLIEKYLTTPRHVEVQVFGDDHGNVVHLFERDCSLQRRYQKVVEEAPAPGMRDERRAEIGAAAVAAAKAIDYSGAGTVEFIVDATTDGANGPFYFMEMNTRLQVEHPVTEFITGLDLVEWQLRVANGETLPLGQSDISLNGHAIEARLYAEDPTRDFLPAPGHVVAFEAPEMSRAVRIDTGVRTGDDIAVSYDPMIAKVIAHGADRDSAIAALDRLLAELVCVGPVTNQAFLRRAIRHPAFMAGAIDTGFIGRHAGALMPRRDGVPNGAITAVCARIFDSRRQSAAARADARGEPNSPWAASDSWRVNLRNGETLIFRDGEAEVSVIAFHDAGQVVLEAPDGRAIGVGNEHGGWRAYGQGNIFFAAADGTQIHLERVVPVEEASERAGASGGLTAPMPGKVVRVMVSAGDKVSRGQTLMVLEAMKMEHAITAPGDGQVAAVFFAEDDQVAEGAELLQLEPVED